MSLLAIRAPGQEREPAPKERWGGLAWVVGVWGEDSEVGGVSQRSGLKVAAVGPK